VISTPVNTGLLSATAIIVRTDGADYKPTS
jgi:hypothetical protein